jgi:hypothetical protein
MQLPLGFKGLIESFVALETGKLQINDDVWTNYVNAFENPVTILCVE